MHPSSLAHSPYYIFPVFTTFTTWTKNRLLPLHFRSKRAQCSSSLTFPSVPHSLVALATQARCTPDIGGHPCKVMRCAVACVTISNHFRPLNPTGLCVAHRFHSRTRHTRAGPTRLDTNAPVITPALYMTPRAPRRPARPLVPFHTPTNSAHLRCIP